MNNRSNIIEVINIILKYYRKNTSFNVLLDRVVEEIRPSKKFTEQLRNEIFDDGYASFFSLINSIINEEICKGKPKDFNKYRVNEKIKFFIFYRIHIINKLFERKRVLTITLKHKSLLGLQKLLFNISDEIWYQSGDESTDFNYYSKRVILMNIYLSSYLYSIYDNSNDLGKTKLFIDKQISRVLKFGKVKSNFKSLFYPKTM
ncbi:MAG: hypothetical protein CBC25_01465 [Pelagibacteraceae bacterium TMED65]|nr:COQ9 family protein [Rickettsiales bacterium]OUU53156.1 MAG: hypothetical protein CBC25_01465 [Pelagibacteraceae bacterium TMED65]